MSKIKTSSSRVTFLDGVRGWASLVVLIGHLSYVAILSTPILEFNKDRLLIDIASYDILGFLSFVLVRFLTDGHLAVLVFFVLSGYALSISHLNFKKKEYSCSSSITLFQANDPCAFHKFYYLFAIKARSFF